MIPQQYKTLWENIRNFPINDPDSSFNFSDKLQQENNWGAFYTSRVIEEYRKFIFLCCAMPGGASPSEQVDKAWHLHLTYTVNYWTDLCKNTLNRELHHHPSKGGADERTKYDDWYQRTLLAYEDFFDQSPPEDIWPPTGTEPEIMVDIYDWRLHMKLVVAFAIALILFLVGFRAFSQPGEIFLLYFAGICLVALGLTYYLQLHKMKRLRSIIEQYFPVNATLFQKAKFLFGAHRAYQAMLVDLINRGEISTNDKLFVMKGTKKATDLEEENPLLPILYGYVPTGRDFSYADGLASIDLSKLDHPRFKMLYRLAQKVDYPKLIIPGMVMLVFLARFVQGLSNDKPLSYLVLEVGLYGLLTLMILSTYSYTRAVYKLGEAYWMYTIESDRNYGQLTADFAITGLPAIAALAEYSDLEKNFKVYPPLKHGSSNDTSSGGGCSGGCSGGGDGGGDGGGGCGGCGGD